MSMNPTKPLELDSPDDIIAPQRFGDIKDLINRLTEKGLDQKILVEQNGSLHEAQLLMNIDPDSSMEQGQFFFKIK